MKRRGATVTLGRTCRVCGNDEWRKRANGTHNCRPCDRARSVVAIRRRRARITPAHRMWESCRDRASQRGTPFTITVEDIEAVWPKDNRCPILGTRFEKKHKRLGASLDRLNNAWGYEPGNIAVISNRANSLKNDASAAELEALVAWMHANGLS